MKKLIVLIFILSIVGCNNHNTKGEVFCPTLDSLLNSYIAQSGNHTKIIYVTFANEAGVELVTFLERWEYDKRFVDGYFFRGGKLIVCYSEDKENRDSLIDYSQTFTLRDSISGYHCMQDGFIANNESHPKTYRIISKDKIIPMDFSKDIRLFHHQEATDTNAFVNKNISIALNSYINAHISKLYSIRFHLLDKKKMFSIHSGFFYDKSIAKYYFYRNGHLVVIYEDEAVDYSFLSKKDIIPFKGSIPKYREAFMEDHWFFPDAELYQILSNNTIKPIDKDDYYMKVMRQK